MLKILSYGGIGDTIRNLGRTPHEFLYRRFGMPCTVVHLSSRIVGSFEYTHPPKPEFIQALIGRTPSLRWGGEVTSRRSFGMVCDKALREAIRFFNHGRQRYFPFTLALTQEELAALPPPTPGFCIGIQPHLSGMRTKQWGFENWSRFLELLQQQYPRAHFIIFDTAPEMQRFITSGRIFTTFGLNLAQSMNLVPRLQFLLSVDSWTKYVAAWSQVPQVVISPDVQSEYAYSTSRQLLRSEFDGIYGNPANLILGLEPDAQGKGVHTLHAMSDLTPTYLFEKVEGHIRARVDPALFSA